MSQTKPDVILLVLDTQRADRMSLYGYHKKTTPIIDRFAEDATVFDWAIATAAWTIPSHASMFTGLYPTVHQTTQSFTALPPDIPTLAEIMREHGYETVAFCNNPLVGVLDNGLKRGFNRFYNYSGTIPETPEIGANSQEPPLRRTLTRWLRGFTSTIERQFGQSPLLLGLATLPFIVPIWSKFFSFKGDTRRSLFDIAAFIRHHDTNHKDQPYFMFVNMMETHLPYYPPSKVVDKWVPYLKKNKAAREFIARFNTESYRWMAPMIEPFSELEEQTLRDMYDAEIAYQDRQLGRVFRALRRTGRLDNTLVIIISDHGESHSDHDFMGHAFVVYNELVRVPLVIRYPAMFPRGKRVAETVSARRVFHTILEAAGISDETISPGSVNALSLARAVDDPPVSPLDEVVVSEAFPPKNFIDVMQDKHPEAVTRFRVKLMRRALYDGKGHKLMVVGEQSDEFFDVHKDPEETANILGDTRLGYENTILHMERALEDYVALAEAQRDGIATGSIQDYSNNPELLARLRALGYIE